MGAGARIGVVALALAAAGALVFLVVGAQEEPPPVAVIAEPVHAPKPPQRQRHSERAPEPGHADEDPLAPSAAPASADILLTGSVVDAASQPVPGATVRAIAPDGAAAEAKSGADGLFSIRWGPRPRTGFVSLGLVATLGGSRAAFSSFDVAHDAAAEEDVGEFVLEASSSLVVRVADAAGPVAGARVFVGSFFGAVFAAATADDRGVARFALAPPADAWLFAYAKGRGRARGEVPPGHPPAVPLVLTLTRRTVTVAVVQTPGDLPLAGEVVAARLVTEADGTKLFSSLVPPQEIAPTGPDGTTRVEDVGEEDGLEILRRDREASPEPWRFAGQHVGPVAVAPREATVRIEVPAGRTIRWRIVPGDADVPDEGTLVSLSRGRSGFLPPRGPAALKVEGGELVGAGFSDGRLAGVVETRDGAVATLFAPTTGERGSDVVFARPRRVVVSIKDDTGSPLAGILVRIKDAGGATAADDETTGDDGTVTFSGLEPGAGKLFVESHAGNPPDVRPLGAVDVSKGDARLDAVLPRVRQVTLRVSVDGERKLPDAWRLLVESLWCEDAVSDAAAAEIRFAARPRTRDGSLRVLAKADGYRDVSLVVPADASACDVVFDRGVTVVADVRLGSANWVPNVILQRWSDREKSWTNGGAGLIAVGRRAGAAGPQTIQRLDPGRYRLFEMGTLSPSAPADVALGGAPGTLVLDLTRVGVASGRVLGPDDKPVPMAWILTEADEGSPAVAGAFDAAGTRSIVRAMSGSDGSFSVFVPGDRPVRLRVTHPLMRPDPEHGSVEVTEPAGGLVLRLAKGPVLAYVVDSSAFGDRSDFGAGPRVLLFDGSLEAEPLARLTPIYDPSSSAPDPRKLRYRAGGFEPGRRTVWIDLLAGAPVVLYGVDLSDGDTDLGEVRPARGAAVRVKPARPAGMDPFEVYVEVRATGACAYVRTGHGKGDEIAVTGLVRGRFDVTVRGAPNSGFEEIRRTIDCDGEHDVVIDSSPR